jgi:hypothetical protein
MRMRIELGFQRRTGRSAQSFCKANRHAREREKGLDGGGERVHKLGVGLGEEALRRVPRDTQGALRGCLLASQYSV